MKTIYNAILLSIFLTLGAIAATPILVYTADNSDGKITPKTIEEQFKKAGFTISDNRDMNLPFTKQFKKTTFDTYNLFTLYKSDTVISLVKEYPNAGLFAPMSMSIYTKKGAKTISISTLTPETMATIMGIPTDNKTLAELGKAVKAVFKSAMPNGKYETMPYKPVAPKGKLVSNYSTEMDADEWEDEKEELQLTIENELKPNGFVMAGFNDLGMVFNENKYNDYEFYDVYSICKLKVIYNIAINHPEAGAFAPCSLYMYKKKGEEKMYMGFPTVYNWIAAMAIDDKGSLAVLEDAQKRMDKILTESLE